MSEGSRSARKGELKRRLPAVLALGGAILGLVGVFLGRGAEQGMGLTLTRLFLLVIGSSVCVAGLVGFAGKAFRRNGEGS